ncbi:MAG: hypothetical protein ACREIA_11330, partial [Opitutaceae bacterium]
MLALPDNAKAALLENANGILLPDSRDLRHASGSNLDDLVSYRTDCRIAANFICARCEVFSDCLADVGQRLLTRLALGATTRQLVAPHGPTFPGFNQGDPVRHHCRLGEPRQGSS